MALLLGRWGAGLPEDGCVATGDTGRKEGQQQGAVGLPKTANSRMKVVTFFPL